MSLAQALCACLSRSVISDLSHCSRFNSVMMQASSNRIDFASSRSREAAVAAPLLGHPSRSLNLILDVLGDNDCTPITTPRLRRMIRVNQKKLGRAGAAVTPGRIEGVFTDCRGGNSKPFQSHLLDDEFDLNLTSGQIRIVRATA